MAALWFPDVQHRLPEFLDCTSLTLAAFQQRVSPVETVFQAPRAAWRRDGTPRTARQFAVP